MGGLKNGSSSEINHTILRVSRIPPIEIKLLEPVVSTDTSSDYDVENEEDYDMSE